MRETVDEIEETLKSACASNNQAVLQCMDRIQWLAGTAVVAAGGKPTPLTDPIPPVGAGG